MKNITAIFLMFVSAPAFAEGITLTWNPPVGTSVCQPGPPLTNVAGYRLYELVADISDPATTSHVFPEVSPGEHTYVATSYLADGQESQFTAPFVEQAGATRVLDETAYTVVKTQETFLLVAVGTIPLGTTCDHTNTVNGHQSVPIDQITWSGTVRPVVAVARCG